MHAELVSHIMSLDVRVQHRIMQAFQKALTAGNLEDTGNINREPQTTPAAPEAAQEEQAAPETAQEEQAAPETAQEEQAAQKAEPETDGITAEIEDAGDQWLEETQQNKKIDWKAVLEIEDDDTFGKIENEIKLNAGTMFDQQKGIEQDKSRVIYFELAEAKFFLFGCYFQMHAIEKLLEVLANDSEITINPDYEGSFFELQHIVEYFKAVKRTYNWVCNHNATFFKMLQDTKMDSTDSTSKALGAMVALHVDRDTAEYNYAYTLLMHVLDGYKVDMEAIIFQHNAITRMQLLKLKIHFEKTRHDELNDALKLLPEEEKLELPVIQISETAQRNCWEVFFEDYQALKNAAHLNEKELTQKKIMKCLGHIVEEDHGFDLLSWNGFKYSESPYEDVKTILVPIEPATKIACFEQMHLVMQAHNIDAIAYDHRLSRYHKMVKTEIMEAEKYGQLQVPQWRQATDATIYKKKTPQQHNKNNHASDILQAFHSKGNFSEFFVQPVDMINILREQDDACQSILASHWFHYLHEITNYVCEMNAAKAPDQAMRETDQAIIRFLCIVKLSRHLYRVVETCTQRYMATKKLTRCKNILTKHNKAFIELESTMKENDAGVIEQSVQNKYHIKQQLSQRALLASI